MAAGQPAVGADLVYLIDISVTGFTANSFSRGEILPELPEVENVAARPAPEPAGPPLTGLQVRFAGVLEPVAARAPGHWSASV